MVLGCRVWILVRGVRLGAMVKLSWEGQATACPLSRHWYVVHALTLEPYENTIQQPFEAVALLIHDGLVADGDRCTPMAGASAQLGVQCTAPGHLFGVFLLCCCCWEGLLLTRK